MTTVCVFDCPETGKRKTGRFSFGGQPFRCFAQGSKVDAVFFHHGLIAADGELAIQRGLRMVYHHRRITRKLFEKYRRRYSPYGSVASLYIWEVSGGGLPELNHPKTANQGSEK